MKQLISIMPFAFLCLKANAQKNDSICANNYTYQQVADLVKSPQLRYLKIYSYKDSILPDIFSKLKNLEYLEINDAKINAIPLSIGSLSKLKTLIICNGWSRKIQIPSEIGKLTQLTNLQLYNYHFESLPPEIGNLVNLQETMLCGDLTDLPSSISNWKKLKSLYLAGNQFTKIPDPIFQLTQLESLDMSDNQLSQLNDSIWMLKQLEELNLSSNIELDQLPPRICELQKLEMIYLQDTKISFLPLCLNENPSLKQIRMCNTVIDNPAAIDSVFKDKMDWEWGCHGLERHLVDFHEIYGHYILNLDKEKDTTILHYNYSYNQPNSIDEEYTRKITIKILHKDSLKTNKVYTATNPHFIISTSHSSVWDWEPSQNQKVVGYLQFVELTDKECKVYLNLELIEQGEKRKLVNKLLVFK
ncbi:leucine-rich repeat domain-containing protein [Fluviicola taffensis]|uniref:leucine-rich repeat domain-containing protein n=1 Tax=Fluviicola taffensis TaxID=191579 RepID=UPI00313828F5